MSLQGRVQAALDEMVAAGFEVGVQAAVFHRGRPVVDATSGVADPRTGRPVSSDTLFYAASTGKGVASTVVHALVERGELDEDMRLVDVWPEFGAHGKHTTTLRHVLLHTAGVPSVPANTTTSDLSDWDHMCAVLADARPWWDPGTRFGYHALTFGFLVGEVVRRATGRTISAQLRDVVTRPLGVEDDVHFGVPPSLLPRVALQVAPDGPEPPGPDPGAPAARAVPPGVAPSAAHANREDVLSATIPSVGTTTARGAALVYAALLGHVEGVPLVSRERLDSMAAVTYSGLDHVMGIQATWAYGYSPFRPGVPGRAGSTFGMVGVNGSGAYADIDSGVAVALVRNRFAVGDFTALASVDAAVAEALS